MEDTGKRLSMKSRWIFHVCLIALMLIGIGCASPAKKVKNLRLGMTPDEVRDELGKPYTVRAAKVYSDEQWTEVWEYLPPLIAVNPKSFWVVFENDRLVQWSEPGDFNTQRTSVKEYSEQKMAR